MDQPQQLNDMDLAAFRGARFEVRTARVELPAYAAAAGLPDASMLVRGLTADEINRAKAARKNGELAEQLAEAMARRSGGDAKRAMQGLFGHGDDVAPDTVVQMETVATGVVEPSDWTLADAVKISNDFPTDFAQLFIGIMQLTGAGKTLAGSPTSGQATPAKAASPLPNETVDTFTSPARTGFPSAT